MDVILLILSFVLLVGGLIGCILPAVPGPPLSYVAILLLHFTRFADFSTKFLLITAGVTVIITVADYVLPAWGTKKFGGSRAGVTGAMVGLFLGLFFLPIGIIAGPFAGAVVGEIITGGKTNVAIRSGIGSFIGFLFGTAMKLTVCIAFFYYYFKEFIIWILARKNTFSLRLC